jgi:hypothetical protein
MKINKSMEFIALNYCVIFEAQNNKKDSVYFEKCG